MSSLAREPGSYDTVVCLSRGLQTNDYDYDGAKGDHGGRGSVSTLVFAYQGFIRGDRSKGGLWPKSICHPFWEK